MTTFFYLFSKKNLIDMNRHCLGAGKCMQALQEHCDALAGRHILPSATEIVPATHMARQRGMVHGREEFRCCGMEHQEEVGTLGFYDREQRWHKGDWLLRQGATWHSGCGHSDRGRSQASGRGQVALATTSHANCHSPIEPNPYGLALQISTIRL